jgi:hypothetical protein
VTWNGVVTHLRSGRSSSSVDAVRWFLILFCNRGGVELRLQRQLACMSLPASDAVTARCQLRLHSGFSVLRPQVATQDCAAQMCTESCCHYCVLRHLLVVIQADMTTAECAPTTTAADAQPPARCPGQGAADTQQLPIYLPEKADRAQSIRNAAGCRQVHSRNTANTQDALEICRACSYVPSWDQDESACYCASSACTCS